MGPDCICTINFFQFDMFLNADCTPDFMHGVHDDVLNGLKSADLNSHLVLSLLRINVPHSPWHEVVRYKQVMGSLSELCKSTTPEDCALWQDLSHEMLSEAAGE